MQRKNCPEQVAVVGADSISIRCQINVSLALHLNVLCEFMFKVELERASKSSYCFTSEDRRNG